MKQITITVNKNQIDIDTEMESYEVVGLLTNVLHHYQAQNLLPTVSKLVDEYLSQSQQEEDK